MDHDRMVRSEDHRLPGEGPVVHNLGQAAAGNHGHRDAALVRRAQRQLLDERDRVRTSVALRVARAQFVRLQQHPLGIAAGIHQLLQGFPGAMPRKGVEPLVVDQPVVFGVGQDDVGDLRFRRLQQAEFLLELVVQLEIVEGKRTCKRFLKLSRVDHIVQRRVDGSKHLLHAVLRLAHHLDAALADMPLNGCGGLHVGEEADRQNRSDAYGATENDHPDVHARLGHEAAFSSDAM